MGLALTPVRPRSRPHPRRRRCRRCRRCRRWRRHCCCGYYPCGSICWRIRRRRPACVVGRAAAAAAAAAGGGCAAAAAGGSKNKRAAVRKRHRQGLPALQNLRADRTTTQRNSQGDQTPPRKLALLTFGTATLQQWHCCIMHLSLLLQALCSSTRGGGWCQSLAATKALLRCYYSSVKTCVHHHCELFPARFIAPHAANLPQCKTKSKPPTAVHQLPPTEKERSGRALAPVK